MTLQSSGSMKSTEWVVDFLDAKIDDGHFSGASVVYGRAGKILLNVQRGSLSKDVDVPVRAQTVFDLQSMTKALITGVLLLDEEALGMNLNQSIDDFLPANGPAALVGQNISFKNLAVHNSGVSDASLEALGGLELKTAHSLWTAMYSSAPAFPAGEQMEYSDFGYRILGKAIESKTGRRIDANFVSHRELGFSPFDPFDVAGCPNAFGTIDDDQVRLLGSPLGCDGLFGSAQAVFQLTNQIFARHSEAIQKHRVESADAGRSFYHTLAHGSKSVGWECNTPQFNYCGDFFSETVFEKAGGAGTFVWFDSVTTDCVVYLTNHGKPVPFMAESWNQLLQDLEPSTLSNLIYSSR